MVRNSGSRLQFQTYSIRTCIFKEFVYLVLERGEGGKRWRKASVWERNVGWLALTCEPNRDLPHNPGMSPGPPELESNRQPFLCWDIAAQPTESCGSVLKLHFYQEPIRIWCKSFPCLHPLCNKKRHVTFTFLSPKLQGPSFASVTCFLSLCSPAASLLLPLWLSK